jgi:hypothetical protein
MGNRWFPEDFPLNQTIEYTKLVKNMNPHDLHEGMWNPLPKLKTKLHDRFTQLQTNTKSY